MSNKLITLEDVLDCSALKGMIMQVVILSQTKEDQTIEEFADEVMKHDGMQAYIQRLGFQIQKKMKEPVDDDSFPW